MCNTAPLLPCAPPWLCARIKSRTVYERESCAKERFRVVCTRLPSVIPRPGATTRDVCAYATVRRVQNRLRSRCDVRFNSVCANYRLFRCGLVPASYQAFAKVSIIRCIYIYILPRKIIPANGHCFYINRVKQEGTNPAMTQFLVSSY